MSMGQKVEIRGTYERNIFVGHTLSDRPSTGLRLPVEPEVADECAGCGYSTTAVIEPSNAAATRCEGQQVALPDKAVNRHPSSYLCDEYYK